MLAMNCRRGRQTVHAGHERVKKNRISEACRSSDVIVSRKYHETRSGSPALVAWEICGCINLLMEIVIF
jgi:hypothetical protein